MNSLTQYIDLYIHHSALLNSNSVKAMNNLRPAAKEILEKNGLPHIGSENYEITDLDKLLSPDYGINIARVNIDVNPAASFRCGVPGMSSFLFFLINDSYAEASTAKSGLPEGVFVGSLKRFAEEYPEEMMRYYGSVADLKNPLVALNTMLAQDGIAIRVKKGVRMEKPLQIVNILQNGVPLMAVRRLLIIVEDEAELKILSCDHTQNPDIDYLALQTTEIITGNNATLDYYDLEESSQKTTRLSTIYMNQGEGSNVLLDGITLYNGTTRNEYYTRFTGERAELKLFGMGIEDRSRRLDTYSRIEHGVKDCKTLELFKYVVDDEAAGCFGGLIVVAPGAQKSEAYQSNRNIVGSDDARMYSKPQLEIYNDDVKCSHGSATGQIDEQQIFYMQTRGIPETTARLLLKQAFMADVIDGVRLSGLKERLQLLVERRFAGGCVNCNTCHGVNNQ